MKFVVIDASNLVHRAKHAVGARVPMPSTYDPFGTVDDDADALRVGMILDVVFGGMLNAMQRFGAEHCVAAFDMRSWRRDVYEDYKANRRDKVRTPDEEHDQELIAQTLDEFRDFLRDFTNVTVLETEGAEADDLIARWVQLHTEPHHTNIIVSADGDFKQLVQDRVDLFNPMTGTLYTTDGIYFQDGRKPKGTEETVLRHGQQWKIKLNKAGEPEMFDAKWELFEKCIRGDSSDNIRSAWPRVHTTKMRAAYDGDVVAWNNFINSTWGVGDDKHSVRELYEQNRVLIDLTLQPDEVKDLMDSAIVEAVERPPARMIGAYFARFCSRYKLLKMLQQAEKYTSMLAREYKP